MTSIYAVSEARQRVELVCPSRWLALALGASCLLGCRGETSKEPPLVGIRNMYDQPKYDVQEESAFFADHRAMRPLVEGVVSTEEETEPGVAQGRLEDQSGYVLTIPSSVIASLTMGAMGASVPTAAQVQSAGAGSPAPSGGGSGTATGIEALTVRGKARYGIYCTPCHGNTGNGNGIVKKRAVASGATAFVPPTFHQDRIRHMPDGQLFATITNGKNNMPPYAMQIPVNDRWAIVAYVRALQIAEPKPETSP